ncbi:hypothetical protein [Photobacterium damselae]|uniref:hypothetical protein n=1 Tax=Photobacterium damselae TaxID=38293 RepID=UPI001F343161|nr:hypothetical protein [Photobacterium damselae]UKA03993.1 hypothetical protein IHC89_15810 [Photobacterium damselae subsp. damselae]
MNKVNIALCLSVLISSVSMANVVTGNNSNSSFVCVNLPFGVGYVSSNLCYYTKFQSPTTEKFNLSETRCINVDEVTDDEPVSDHVMPILSSSGLEVVCTPNFAKQSGTSKNYQSRGTIWASWREEVK